MILMEIVKKPRDLVKKLEYIGVIPDYREKPLATCEEAHEGPHVSSLRLNGGRRPGNSIRAREGRTSKKRERIDTI